MTESEWLACADPSAMTRFLSRHATGRKGRLFACACCRRVWPLLPERSRRRVEVAERFADGEAGPEDLAEAWRSAPRHNLSPGGRAALTACAEVVDLEEARTAAAKAATDGMAERRAQCELLRDVFGNPFRRVPVVRVWLEANGGLVVKLAWTIYVRRDFGSLPVLADALEEAGCTDADILGHCRFGTEHARGCWALDALLGVPAPAPRPLPEEAWTVVRRVVAEGRVAHQVNGRGRFAQVRLAVEPCARTGPFALYLDHALSADAAYYTHGIEDGFRRFVAAQAAHGRRVERARVQLLEVRSVPVDSSNEAFAEAMVAALTQAFEVAGRRLPPALPEADRPESRL